MAQRATVIALVVLLIGGGVLLTAMTGGVLYWAISQTREPAADEGPTPLPPAQFVPESQRVKPVQTAPYTVVRFADLQVDHPLDEAGYPQVTVLVAELSDLFWMGKFAEATRILHGYREMLDADHRYEGVFYQAMESFEQTGEVAEGQFDAWISHYPDDAMVLLARATHLAHSGYEARGTAWARDTSKEQFASMQRYLDRAAEDARRAALLDPELTYPHSILLGMSRTQSGRYGSAREHLDAGLAINPYSFALRNQYMSHLLPRWHGSHAEMRAFADESQSVADIEPRVKQLYADIYWDQASMAWHNKRPPEEVIALASAALEHGPDLASLRLRANRLTELGRYDEAILDWEAIINLDPLNEWRRWQLARALAGAARQAELAEVHALAVQHFGPKNHAVLEIEKLME